MTGAPERLHMHATKTESADEHICEVSCERFYEIIRSNIQHEDQLINHRLSWLIQSQSAFFLAFGMLAIHPENHLRHFAGALVVVAPASCAVLYVGIVAAVRVIYRYLRIQAGRFASEVPAMHALPEIRRRDAFRGIVAPLALPPLFILAWIVVALDLHG